MGVPILASHRNTTINQDLLHFLVHLSGRRNTPRIRMSAGDTKFSVSFNHVSVFSEFSVFSVFSVFLAGYFDVLKSGPLKLASGLSQSIRSP